MKTFKMSRTFLAFFGGTLFGVLIMSIVVCSNIPVL